ncbi:MAG: histone deacetylase family protein [Rhodobacterales bacterium]|jgi:acetoin utilization deacetylase AcuC-like enzyme|nr:histone deacetylase family protein [Pseudomonadota bacterium]MDA1285653.1 histone deacetylase family protein [Pseudomonadota bacterium]HBN30733.1 acetoin utilization protein [Paracoccaceae bacterium]
MTTAFLSHNDCLNHLTPPGHPERVERMQAINAAFAAPEFSSLKRVAAPIGEDAHVLLAHPVAYLDMIRAAVPVSGLRSLDPDTHMSPGSFNAAMRGVGGNVKAVDMVLAGEVSNAFVACRPPGHHAEKSTAMGFCLFGNVAIAAKYALDHHGLNRVAIIDFDVHHGNGTQDLVWDDRRIFFASTHQMPLYPGTGAPSETGAHNNILNVPLDPGTGGTVFRQKMRDLVLPAVEAFQPEMIFVSAGFDAHRDDPLANLNLIEDDFTWATQAICDLADRVAGGRIVSTLEGGYDLEALAASAVAHVRVLMERGV